MFPASFRKLESTSMTSVFSMECTPKGSHMARPHFSSTPERAISSGRQWALGSVKAWGVKTKICPPLSPSILPPTKVGHETTVTPSCPPYTKVRSWGNQEIVMPSPNWQILKAPSHPRRVAGNMISSNGSIASRPDPNRTPPWKGRSTLWKWPGGCKIMRTA